MTGPIGETGGPGSRTTGSMADSRERTGDGASAASTAHGSPGARVDFDVFGRPAPAGGDWSHRRGEPRIFAFFWTLYLLFATIGAFWAVGPPGAHDALAMRPAARSLLAAITVGVVLLWPMTRLSQTAPSTRRGRIARAVLQDLLVILVPAQAVIWPQIVMAVWPVSVVAAMAASLAAWAMVIGGVLVWGLSIGGGFRGWWMLVLVALAGLGPLLALGPLGGSHSTEGAIDWWWMTSPVTSGFEITRDRPWTGASAAVTEGHWRAIGAVGVAGAVVWGVFGVVGLFRRVERA